MNFFKEQKDTQQKIFVFRILFVLTLFLVSFFTALIIWYYVQTSIDFIMFLKYSFTGSVEHLNHGNFFYYYGVTAALMLIISIIRRNQLTEGGSYIAEALGGKKIPTNSNDMGHSRLKNIVEEMSLASGIIPPQIYILEDETDINAFAAGFTINDAVIGVSKGCLDRLNRDELQGVVAHEIGHIVNGDMRLNIEMTGYLFGISFISEIGYVMIRNHSVRRDHLMGITGILFIFVGILGDFFGYLLKQIILRNQEFWADARAVQYTRNPEGIGGALKKILKKGKSFGVYSVRGHEFSHIWFHWPKPQMSFLSSHPPIEKRIKKILPQFDVENFVPKEKHNLSSLVDENFSKEINQSFASFDAVHLLKGQNNYAFKTHSEINSSKNLSEEMSFKNFKECVEAKAHQFFEMISSQSKISKEAEQKFILEMDVLLNDIRNTDKQTCHKILNRFREIIVADKKVTPREILCFILFKDVLIKDRKIPLRGIGLRKVKKEIQIIFSFLANISVKDSDIQKQYFQNALELIYGQKNIDMPTHYKTGELIKSFEACRDLVPKAKEKLFQTSLFIIEKGEESSFSSEAFKKVLALMLRIPSTVVEDRISSKLRNVSPQNIF
jgi:Zn-dependent protease with chaperone function